MGEIKTEEERKNYIKELRRISQKIYGKDYHELCDDKKRVIRTLYKTGDF